MSKIASIVPLKKLCRMKMKAHFIAKVSRVTSAMLSLCYYACHRGSGERRVKAEGGNGMHKLRSWRKIWRCKGFITESGVHLVAQVLLSWPNYLSNDGEWLTSSSSTTDALLWGEIKAGPWRHLIDDSNAVANLISFPILGGGGFIMPPNWRDEMDCPN